MIFGRLSITLRQRHFGRESEQNVRLKLDEGLSNRLKPTLQELGHDVDTVIDEGLKSEADTVVADTARQNDRMLFTLDKGLVNFNLEQYAPGKHPGIVVFRLKSFGRGTVTRFVEDFVRSQDLDKFIGCVAIVEPGKVRIRRKDDSNETNTPSSD